MTLEQAARAPWLATWRVVWAWLAQGHGEHADQVIGDVLDEVCDELRKAEGKCRQCGCTDTRACPVKVRQDGELVLVGCWWVEDDLCSACAADPA